MDFDTVNLWLTNYINKQIRNRRLLALLGLALLPFATVIGGALIYGFCFAATHQSRTENDNLADANCLWTTLGILVVMFIVNAFIPMKKEPEKYYSEHPDTDDSIVGHYVRRQKIMMIFFLWIILTGPRLLSWSTYSFKEISRWKKQDVHSCAALLWLMMTKRGKVPYDSIPQELDWLDVETTLSQIQRLPGIVFLKNPPPGISMTDDLRNAIRGGTPI